MNCFHQRRLAFLVERAHSANMTRKMSLDYKVCEDSLVRSWGVSIKHGAGSSEWLDQIARQHEETES